MSTPVAVGVIGAGKISEQYLANFARYPDLHLNLSCPTGVVL